MFSHVALPELNIDNIYDLLTMVQTMRGLKNTESQRKRVRTTCNCLLYSKVEHILFILEEECVVGCKPAVMPSSPNTQTTIHTRGGVWGWV